LLRQCNEVLCMTEVERRQFERVGISPAKLETIGLGINWQEATGGSGTRVLQRYSIDGPVVLHLGMKAYEKGSVTLVEAMKSLWQQGSRAWLMMAGSSLSAFDEYLSAQPQPLPRLVNLPAFDDKEKRDLLAAATVVAQPSRVESLGLVLIEAWANSKPVVAADIEVSRKLVTDSGGGVVTPFGESAALAAAIQKFLDDPEMCREMGRRGQRSALNYDGSILWARNVEIFERINSR